MEIDFSVLMTTGRLASPSLYIPGHAVSAKRKTTTSYRPCGSDDPADERKKNKNKYFYHSSSTKLVFNNVFYFISLFIWIFHL